jgi:ribosomal-protein-alanine acetyltransferase
MPIMSAGATRNRIGRMRRPNSMALPSAEIVIRPIGLDDAGALSALESRCEGAAKWGESAYRDISTNGITGWAATRGSVILGFIAARSVADEMEILNLGVDPEARRQGIGARLVAQAVEAGREARVRRVYLEVRESNSGAQAFYTSLGFAERGRRKNYYSQPVEDALVLALVRD